MVDRVFGAGSVRFGSLMVHVTKEDIRKGQRYEKRTCQVARALNRTYQGTWLVDAVYIHEEESMTFYDTPKRVAMFLWAFDAGPPYPKGVKPFSFTIG